MIEEIPMPVAEVRAKTADEWAELWRVEADSRNELWRSWKALANQHKEAQAEIKRLTELLDACTVHSCGDDCQRPTCKRAMRNAIKDAYWQLLPFLKPGDEKTKAVLEQLQKFL